MTQINFLQEVNNQDKNKAIESLISGSSPRQSFFFMVGSSVAMATLGMLLNSTAVVIGSMLIAPVLYPILSLSMGITISDQKLISRSFTTLIKAVLIAILTSTFIALVFSSSGTDITNEIIKRTEPNLLNLAVAIIAGLAVSFAIAKPSINESLPGVAISVSLVPPLAVIGIGLSRLNLSIASPALILFFINIVGIMFSAMIIFSLMGFAIKRKTIHNEVVKDEAIVEKQTLK